MTIRLLEKNRMNDIEVDVVFYFKNYIQFLFSGNSLPIPNRYYSLLNTESAVHKNNNIRRFMAVCDISALFCTRFVFLHLLSLLLLVLKGKAILFHYD